MPQSLKPFEIERGADFAYKARFRRKTAPQTYVDEDVSGRTFAAVLKRTLADTEVLADFEVVMTQAETGFVFLTLTDLVTAELPEGTWRAKFSQTDGDFTQPLWTRQAVVFS
jgi:hypothetical protein